MGVLTVGSKEIHYKLVRSDKATLARLTVTPDQVELVVPSSATEDEIDDVLARRRGWLVEQKRQMSEKVTKTATLRRYISGAKVPYRGRLMKLTVVSHGLGTVDVAYRHGLHVSCPSTAPESERDAMIRSALRLWFRQRMREDATAFVKQHGLPNSLRPKRVSVKDQKHLWGSCSKDGVVNLNWHLIFAPKPVLEYAVVHELCHLRHRNHDRSFWKLVGTILPDWETRKAWLDNNEHFLDFKSL